MTKCIRYALEAARKTLTADYEVTVQHGGRHATHLHVTKEGSLWRIPVSTGGNRDEASPTKLVVKRCNEIMRGVWGSQTA
jgi:hypothetical protein